MGIQNIHHMSVHENTSNCSLSSDFDNLSQYPSEGNPHLNMLFSLEQVLMQQNVAQQLSLLQDINRLRDFIIQSNEDTLENQQKISDLQSANRDLLSSLTTMQD